MAHPPSPSSERRVVLLFVAVLVLLPVQFVVARKAGEFYPAILMPSFGGAPVDPAGRCSYRTGDLVVSFADGSRATVTWREVFAGIPPTHVHPVAVFNLEGQGDPPPASFPPAGWFAEHVVPAYAAGRLRRQYALPPDPRMIAWLHARLATLFPGRDPVAADLVSRTEHYRYTAAHFAPDGPPTEVTVKKISF